GPKCPTIVAAVPDCSYLGSVSLFQSRQPARVACGLASGPAMNYDGESPECGVESPNSKGGVSSFAAATRPPESGAGDDQRDKRVSHDVRRRASRDVLDDRRPLDGGLVRGFGKVDVGRRHLIGPVVFELCQPPIPRSGVARKVQVLQQL